MKTIEKKYYVCETCGRTSLDEEKIQACQGGHRLIDDTCEIEHSFSKGGRYPKSLFVRWPDGATAIFGLAKCQNPPEPKEAEED